MSGSPARNGGSFKLGMSISYPLFTLLSVDIYVTNAGAGGVVGVNR